MKVLKKPYKTPDVLIEKFTIMDIVRTSPSQDKYDDEDDLDGVNGIIEF